jgi:ABC-type dipeptide/oligopeptide/nickel transport system ATPase component
MSHLLEVNNLHTYFQTREGLVCAVQGVSFQLERGELLGLVGESGCGKSITALSIMRLVAPPGKVVAGEILFEGRNLLKFSIAEMRGVRGNDIAMIFQDPMTSLNRFSRWASKLPKPSVTPASFTKDARAAAAVQAMREVAIPRSGVAR